MSANSFFLRFKNTALKRINLPKHKILVAVSGGVDSIVLVYLLKKLNVNFAIAHCNFKLRGTESDEDEKFVQNIANELKINFYCKSFETKKIHNTTKLSLQETARKLRYDWFEQLCIQYKFDFLATAHHLNDSIETLILNLVHGCGIRGLHGIPEFNSSGNIIRPLLQFPKKEILDFAKKEGLSYRDDSSNQSLKYERNKIRQQVIPVFENLNPGLYGTFSENFSIFKEVEFLYQFAVKSLLNKIIVYDEKYVLKISIHKLKESLAARSLLFEALNPYGFNQKQIIQILEHIDKQSGAVYFSQGFKLTKSYDFFILEKKAENIDAEENLTINSEPDEIGISCIFGNDKFNLKAYSLNKSVDFTRPDIAFFDADKIIYPITIRKPQSGDIFYPFGMSGKMKSLSKFFKDAKINLLERKSVSLICSGNEIMWVVGLRTDDRFKIDDKTQKVLEISMIQNDEY